MKKYYYKLFLAQLELETSLCRAVSDNYLNAVIAYKIVKKIDEDNFNDILQGQIDFLAETDSVSLFLLQTTFHKSLRQTDCMGEFSEILYHILNINRINLTFTKFLKFILFELSDVMTHNKFKTFRKKPTSDKEKIFHVTDWLKYWSKANDF